MTSITLTLPAETVAAVDGILAQRRREEGSAPTRAEFLQEVFSKEVASRVEWFLTGRASYEADQLASEEAWDEEVRLIREHPDQSQVSVELPAGLMARFDVCLQRLGKMDPKWLGQPREAALEQLIEDEVVHLNVVGLLHHELCEAETVAPQTRH